MLLLIDNYDRFTLNLLQLLATLGDEVEVRRNDEISVEEERALQPAGIVISPGPGTPSHAGVSVDLIRDAEVPVLGVCLGHQCIGAAVGGRVTAAPEPMHGKVSSVIHTGAGVFAGVPSPFEAVR